MNIFDHLIPEKYIVGIGCLMREFRGSEIRFYFDLHLAMHTAVIKSEWYKNDPTLDQDKKAYWKEHYEVIKERIAKTIGELTDDRKVHEAEVEKLYQDSLSTMEDLLALLQPTSEELTTAVHLKTHRMAANIEEFKTLALK
jgi:hypothetical protein